MPFDCRSSLTEQAAPSIKQVWRNAVPSGRGGNRLSRLKALLDDPKFLFGCPMSAPGFAADHFDTSLDISLSSSTGLNFSAYVECPVKMGGSSPSYACDLW